MNREEMKLALEDIPNLSDAAVRRIAMKLRAALRASAAQEEGERRIALEPFAALGGPNDGILPAFHDLADDVVIYANSGKCITAGDVRAARNAIGWLHAPWTKQPDLAALAPATDDGK